MALAAFKHPYAATLLRKKGLNETTVLFEYSADGPAKGMKCRSRIDKIIPGDGIIVDIKTAQDASPKGFQRAVVKYNYHRQAMFYRDALGVCGAKGYEGAADWPWVWIVIESSAPYCVGVYALEPLAEDRGRELHQLAMFTLANCIHDDTWPHYTNEAEILRLPPWAYKDYDTTEVIA